MSRAALRWRESVALLIVQASRPMLVGNVELAIHAAPGRAPIVTPHERQCVLDVLRCCRVIADRQQVSHIGIGIWSGLEASKLHLMASETVREAHA